MATIDPQALHGKVALVTGAGSGIGRATSLAFAAAGATVVSSDMVCESGEETAMRIREAGGDACFIRADVTKPDEIRALISSTVERYGQLDCACNNAGIGVVGRFHEISEEDWQRTLAVNLSGVFHCMQQEIVQMLRQGHGSIVNIASIAGLVGLRDSAAYVASKHGVVGLTRTAAIELAPEGIRVNAVCPGFVHTPMVVRPNTPAGAIADISARHPIGRLGTPEEIAAVVVWISSDAPSFVTGHTLVADGGYTAL